MTWRDGGRRWDGGRPDRQVSQHPPTGRRCRSCHASVMCCHHAHCMPTTEKSLYNCQTKQEPSTSMPEPARYSLSCVRVPAPPPFRPPAASPRYDGGMEQYFVVGAAGSKERHHPAQQPQQRKWTPSISSSIKSKSNSGIKNNSGITSPLVSASLARLVPALITRTFSIVAASAGGVLPPNAIPAKARRVRGCSAIRPRCDSKSRSALLASPRERIPEKAPLR